MSVIVTDDGFAPAPDTAFEGVEALADQARRGLALELPVDLDPAALAEIADARERIALIRIPFASLSDGRGFTLARHLRLLGYAGRLRASGHVIADQYAMARRCGFDEVEIDNALAARQPEAQWLARADWRALDYQAKLGATRDTAQAARPAAGRLGPAPATSATSG